MEGKNKCDTSNNRSDWDDFKIIQKIHNNIPGNHEVKELKKTAILGTAHILRKVLTYKYNSANAGTSYIDTINSNDRIAETLYFLETGLSQEYMYV